MIHVFYIGSGLILRGTENRINKFERLDCSVQDRTTHTIGVGYTCGSTENIARYSSKIINRVYSR